MSLISARLRIAETESVPSTGFDLSGLLFIAIGVIVLVVAAIVVLRRRGGDDG